MSGLPIRIPGLRGVAARLGALVLLSTVVLAALVTALPSVAGAATGSPRPASSSTPPPSGSDDPIGGILQIVAEAGTALTGLVGSSGTPGTAPTHPVPTGAPGRTTPTTAPSSAPRSGRTHRRGTTPRRSLPSGHTVSPTRRHAGGAVPRRSTTPSRAPAKHGARPRTERVARAQDGSALRGTSRRLGVSKPLIEQRVAKLADALDPVIRPGETVMLLMAATAGLAVLILALLVLVGRRPDPRIAASANRLRSRDTD